MARIVLFAQRIHAPRFVGVSMVHHHKARLLGDQAVAPARDAAELP
jgi:hypothetical protein